MAFDPLNTAEPDGGPGRSARLAHVCLAAGFVLAGLLLVPWHPADVSYPLERAWALVLHLAFLRGLRFGTEIVFSFGPWGFLWRGYHPGTYAVSIAAWALLSFAFVESLWWILRRRADRLASALTVGIAVFTVLVKGREALLTTLPLLWFFVGREETASVRFAALTAATALAALGKFSLLLLLAPLAILLAADEIFRRRRPSISLLALAAGLVAWWLAAGQKLPDLYPFFRNGVDLALHYGDAMGVEPRWAVPPLGPFAVAAALLLLFALFATGAADRAWRWIDLTALATGIFLAFKSGFIRWDFDHVPAAYGTILLTMLLVGAVAWPRSGESRRILYLSPLIPVMVAAGTLLHYEDRSTTRIVGSARDVASLVLRWRTPAPELAERFARFIESAEARVSDLRPNGTVDVFPILASAVAERPNYAPRPVFQSYSAFSAHLARLNAEHLRKNAPDQILFDIEPLDGRYPALEDSVSWLEIISRYDLAESGRSFLLLALRDHPREQRVRNIASRVVPLGSPVSVPSDRGRLWVEIHVEKTPLGRLVSFLYKAPAVTMLVRTADGRQHEYRVTLDVAAGGFLLSPLVGSRQDFAALLSGRDVPGRAVTEVRIRAADSLYRRQMRISMAAVAFEPGF